MEKIKFTFEDTKETVEFYVLEQTRINGSTYILVTDSEEDDAECLILKESGAEEGQEIVYDIVEDDTELLAVSKVITRDGEQIFEGALASLKRFKDDVKEVKEGYECGLVFEKFNDIKEEDTVEAYTMVEVPR